MRKVVLEKTGTLKSGPYNAPDENESMKVLNNSSLKFSSSIYESRDYTFLQSTPSQKFKDPKLFCRELFPVYIKALKYYSSMHPELGIKESDIPIYAHMLVAQDGLESRWGQSFAGLNNYGNITVGSSGASYTLGKDHDGKGNPIVQKFRNFQSKEAFVRYKISLVGGSMYEAFKYGPNGFYKQIVKGGYAGDPEYYNKLLSSFKTEQKFARG